MQTSATVLALVVAVEHFYIMYLEMFKIPSPQAARVFGSRYCVGAVFCARQCAKQRHLAVPWFCDCRSRMGRDYVKQRHFAQTGFARVVGICCHGGVCFSGECMICFEAGCTRRACLRMGTNRGEKR